MDALLVLICFLLFFTIVLNIIIIVILIYNIIKRNERLVQPQNMQEKKDGVGFGRH